MIAGAQQDGFDETKRLCERILDRFDENGEWNEVTKQTLEMLHEQFESHPQTYPDVLTGLVLESLHYREIDYRSEGIAIAYQETFQWIFEKPTNSLWADFVAWMRDSNAGLYWITGKPGSGKSTLMK